MRGALTAAGLIACASCTFGADDYRFAARGGAAASAGAAPGGGPQAGKSGAAGQDGAGRGGAGQGGAGQSGTTSGQGGAGASGAGAGGAAGAKPACQKSDRACDGKKELVCAADQSKLEPSRECGPSSTCEPGVGCVSPLEVVAGIETTCARYDDGTARCWGENGLGQLGVGVVGGKQPVPSKVSSPDGATKLGAVTSLAVGWRSACAVSAGDAYCWGSDDNGQLGDGPGQTPETGRPVKVKLPTKAKQIAGALLTFCALTTDDQVWCWGSNKGGLLLGPNLLEEQPVLPGVGASGSISVGASTICSRVGTTVKCWGLNFRGEAGIGKTDALAHDPDFVRWAPGDPPITGVTQISVGGAALLGNNPTSHLLLATGNGQTNGALACWGWNEKGQCLVDPGTPSLTTPQPVSTVSPIQVSAGAQHSCVTFASTPTTPNVQCWGWNEDGQIGNGAKTPSAVKAPFTVPGVANATVSAGAAHTCALGGAARDTIWCWGAGAHGQLGDGGFDPQPSPRVVVVP